MKTRILLVFSLFLLARISAAQYVTIPDANFRAFLKQSYPTCFNSQDMMDTTCSTVLGARRITCYNESIANLQGIQYFKGLDWLDCGYNQLTSLPTLPSGLTFFSCARNQLTNLPALPSGLTSFWCSNNQLTSLPALPSGLTSFWCFKNQLTSLPVLPSTLTELICYNNFNLSCLPSLPSRLDSLDIVNTLITCLPNKPAGLTSSLPVCADPTKICNDHVNLTGKVYLDANNNNQYDANEKILPNFILSPQPTNLINSQFLSSSTGYSFWVDSLARGINIINPYPQAFTVPVSSYSFTPTRGQTLTYNFGLQGNPNYNELESVVAPFVARPGFTSGIVGTVRNVGGTNPTPTVVMRIPTGWVIDSLKPAGGVVRGDSITWNTTTSFDYFEARQFFVWATLPRTTQLGSPYCVTLSARNQQGVAIGARSTKTDCGIVVGSYDPNDKLVKPEQMPPSYNPENELVYTIRFQNTGTYYAENVMILDTISSLLRLETFRLLNKSHNCEVKFKPGRIIEFQFNNIKLPETSRNEPASHGFVQFAMKPVANLPLNTSIGNKGYIYFDFNDPIITNTARTNVSVLGIEVSPEMRLLIAPNPATESCRVEFDTRGKLGTLTLTDALGRTVKSVELQGNGQHDFSVADMPSGVYYLRVNAEGKLLASGKLVVGK